MSTQLESRIVGSLRPDTELFITDGKQYMDLSAYDFEMTCRRQGSSTDVWVKTTGLTGAVGSKTQPNLVISWEPEDLGTLSLGSYVFIVKMTFDGRPYIFTLTMVIVRER